MKTLLELPSGKILDLTRFIALVPSEPTPDSRYELILSGYSNPIHLEQKEADAVKQFLFSHETHQAQAGWDSEEQLSRNQPAMKLLKEWIERDKNRQPTPESEESFEEFKRIIDAERPPGQKLYSVE